MYASAYTLTFAGAYTLHRMDSGVILEDSGHC